MRHIVAVIALSFVLVSCANQPLDFGMHLARKKETTQTDYSDAKQAFESGKYTDAVALYQVSAPDASNPDALFGYAEALRLSGKTAKAIGVYDQVLQANPNALQAMEGKSLAYVADGKFKQAATLLSAVLDKNAAQWRTINALGVIYALTGHLKESLEYYDMALQVSGDNPTVLNNIGLSVAFSGDYARGQKMVEKALSYTPESEQDKREKIELNLAMIAGISGDMDSAEKILSRHLSRAEVLNNLGFYAKLADNKPLAKTYLSQALTASPVHYERAWNNLKDLEKPGKGKAS